MQNSAKIMQIVKLKTIWAELAFRHLFASKSQFLPKSANFLGGQNELTLVTLMQNSAKIIKNRQTEDNLGRIGFQASICIHS